MQEQQIPPQRLNEVANQLLSYLFRTFSVYMIIGDWKTGKTDFSLLIAETLLNNGVVSQVASNIETKDPRVVFISSIQTIKLWLHKDRSAKLYILDEGNTSLGRRGAMRKINVEAISLLPEISKAHARLIVISHYVDKIDAEFLSLTWLRGIFKKESRKSAQFIFLREETDPLSITDIPRSTINFDPDAIAPLTLKEVDLLPLFKDELLQKFWKYRSGTKQADLWKSREQYKRDLMKLLETVLPHYVEVTRHNNEREVTLPSTV